MKKPERIEITVKTRNTKALRKRIYKNALAYIKWYIERDGRYNMGFCAVVDSALEFNGEYDPKRDKFDIYEDNNVFVELMAYKPNNPLMVYWWPVDAEGTAKRIAILEEIISKM